MALLQNRLDSDGMNKGWRQLIKINKDRQRVLRDNWEKIRKVDYAPVVDPALAVLLNLPSNESTDCLLETLIKAVLECSSRIRGLHLDHAGPLYHGLLETARYDGSFYTSTAAAVLLAELAMPPDWTTVGKNGWRNARKLADLKICDPACGTGTLLMAAANTIERRFLSATGRKGNLQSLHLGLIESVLHGLDINRHAIHLAASMLTISAPKIDYNKMNLYNMQHGLSKGKKKESRAGSLDILIEDAGFIPHFVPETSHRRTTGEGYKEEAPSLKELCDLVIMNPPFTRNDIRNRNLPKNERKKVQDHEKWIARETLDEVHRNAIDQSTIFTFFPPIADTLLKKQQGTLAMVAPFTICTGAAASGVRRLLTDSKRFHVELVVTSHDNHRINFSDNTNIHESLIIVRRMATNSPPLPPKGYS